MIKERVCCSVIGCDYDVSQKSNLFGRGKKKLLTILWFNASKSDHDWIALRAADEGRSTLGIQQDLSGARMRTQNMITLYHRQVLSLIAFLFAGAIINQAQSGRRSNGGTTTTTAPSVSGPRTVEKKPEKPPRLQLLVGADNRDAMSNIPYYVTDTVLDNCVRRLGDASDVMVTSAGRVMNRAEAIKRAKEETIRYVVWLQIGSELADSGRKPSSNSVDELYVSYTITGRGGVSTPNKNSPLYSEYALKQAARETAERILAAFEIKLSDDRIMH